MANTVQGALIPRVSDTPLDQRAVIDTLAGIYDIEFPYRGLLVYCRETGRTYRVDSLAPRKIGSMVVQDAGVGEYSLFDPQDSWQIIT